MCEKKRNILQKIFVSRKKKRNFAPLFATMPEGAARISIMGHPQF